MIQNEITEMIFPFAVKPTNTKLLIILPRPSDQSQAHNRMWLAVRVILRHSPDPPPLQSPLYLYPLYFLFVSNKWFLIL